MAYNPFRDGKQTQSTQTGRVNPFRQTSADRSDRERVMRNWQSDAEQHGILNNPQYTDEGKAYQQMAQEYAKYGTQYQNQLKQGMTGRQWAADTARRLEELTQQQRAAQQTERRRQDADAIGDPGLWVTTTEQYDALPEARRQEEARKAKQRPAVSLADYDKRIAELRKEKEWADYFADAGLSDEAGYKTGSARGKATYESADAAAARKRISELEQRLVTLNQNSGWASTVEQSDEIERERNAIQQELESLGAGYKNAQQADYTMSWRNGVRDNWTDEERSNFYYLYNGNKDEAQAYARRINDRYAYSDAQAKKEKVGEWASQNFWTGAAGTVASVGMTMTSLADTLDRAREYAATGDVSAKSNLTPADIGMAMTSAIASSLNKKSGTINDNVWVIGGKGLGDLYETGVSILNSLASVYMLGGVGTYANFFGQASKTAYEEGIQRGLSVDKALAYGYASGVAEVAGEIFSIEHLIKMKNPSSLKGIIKNIFVQGGIEASEESATTLMNTISDAIINGDKSELASNYYALIQAGYSSEEASQLAISDWTQGIMYDALGGFVSGTVSGTIQSGVQGSMTYAGDAQELIDYAKSEGADTAAGKRAQKYEKRVQSGKRMTNYQAGTLTELAQEAVVSKDLDNIREAVGKRLSALGENSSALTEAVVRQAVQQEAKAADVSVPKITEKQRGLIQNSKAAKRVLSEMDIGNMRMETAAELSGHDGSQYQRSNEWARDIGTRIIAPGEYGVRSTNTVTAEEKRADVKVGDESGKVVGFKDGMARVEVTENGKSTIREVKPDDVQQLPKQTRRLFDEISHYDGDTQAAMYAAYMPGQDIEAYVQAADTAMNLYGAQTKATLEQARSFGKATFRMLSDAQLDALMQAGRKLADQRKAAAERTGESKGEVKQGKVSYDGGEADGRRLKAPSKEAIDRMSDAEKTLAEALTATGVDVVFYESEANAEGRYSGAQGMYHNGTVYLDVNAGMNSVESGQRTIVLTAAHEMTHFIRENSEAGYIALREFITDRLMQQGLDIEELVTQKRARESRELSYDEAVEEVIADACETVLTEPTAIQQLASDNMPLAKKIRKWLNDFFRKIKSAFAGLEAVHDEAKAMTDYMDELRAMWDGALADAVRNRANKNAAENGDGVRHSYGGRGAENANLDELDRAKRLLAQGVDKDAVRRDTGWFRGADGQWRFEIDDSGLIYSKTGNILGYADSARAQHEYAAKWLALTSAEMTDAQRGELAKYIKQRNNGEFSQELYNKLTEYWGTAFEEYAAAKEAMLARSNASGATVGDYIKHDELFGQYPHLKDLGLVFEDLGSGEKGYFNGLEIVIDRSLKDAPEKTLLHEIQHAIQRFEGFSKGASVEYWNRQLVAGKNVRTRAQLTEEARIENQLTELRIKSPDFYADIMQLEEMAPTTPRGKIDWNTLEQIEPDPPEWQRYDTRREELEQKYGEDRVFSAIDLFNDLAQSRKTTRQLPSELYFNTAGEIEARDVSARAALTKAERAAKAPNLGDGDTVWAKYSLREFSDGTKFVDVQTDQKIFDGLAVDEMPAKARELIKSKFAGKVIGVTNRAYVNGASANEYAHPVKNITDKKIKEAKMRASAELDNLIEAGQNFRTRPDGAYGHKHIRAVGGFSYFDVIFKVGNEYFKGTINIENNAKGARFKDVTKIEDVTKDIVSSIGQNPKSKFLSDISMDSIRSSSENSNTKIKKSERDVDLSAKYPQLNLNEDISELDGVPAIELTDGSVLPITERDGRYPTHVSFIEANRIDVDDLKSGGWIGNGVYDPSFTSDTQRYIERQQARKRVAELTGKPYEQFRYSMRDVTTGDTREELAQRRAAYARLERENAALKARVDYLKGQTKLTKEATVRESDVAKYARSILKEYTSRADSAEIQQQLQELGNYIVQNDARVLSYDEIRSRAEDIAETVLDNAHAVIAEEMPGLGEYKEFLRNTALKVSDNTLNDLPEGFRKEYSGKIKLRADGRSVDSVWMELQERYGEGEFPSNIYAQSDMLEIMADKFSTWQAIEGNPFYNYMGEAIQSLTNDIMDMVLGADIRQTVPTYADRAAAKLARERAKGAEAVAAERERGSARAERLQAMLESERERRREEVAREKADKWAAVGSVREYYQSMIKRQRAERAESADRGKYCAQVEKRTKELSDWLLTNSDKQHVPEVLKKTIGDFLATLDFTSRRALEGGIATQKDARFQQRLSALQELLRKQAAALEENSDADTFTGYLDIDGDTMDALAQLVQDVNAAIGSDRTWTVNRMNAADLARLDQVLKVLQHSVKNMNKLLANAHFKTSIEAAQNTMTRMDALKTNRKYAGKVKDFFAWDNVTPVYAFRRFGDGGKAIFDSFTRGWDKMAFNMRTIYDYAENAYTADEVRAWEKDIREVELSTGKKVRIPVSTIMELYVSAKQEQAMNHLNGGGLRVSDFKDGWATVNQTEHYLMTAEDIAAITGELSDRQRAVADALQRFAAGTGAAWGNEVSMKRFGYRAFTEENYWPIATDDNTRDAIDPQARANDMYRLLNMSMTKGRNAKANNALVVGSIFDTFSAHMADMAKYNALALPVLDAMKWYNYREKETLSTGQIKTASVQGAIEGAYGRGANNYIVTLMKDINGKQELGRGEDLPRKMISNYKVASVAANVRVALLQPTSYVRAGMELDPKYLAKGALIKGGVQEMMKYSGTAIWKNFGGYDTNISRNIRDQIKHDATAGEQIKEKSMVLAELGDRLTWGALWNACKLEVQDKQHLSGEELMQATANRFREVIYLTQVMDSTLTRSHNMRSKSTYASLATAFMSEPTLSYSMVQDAFMDYMDERKISKNGTAAWQKTRGKLVKALGIYAMSAAASAIIESLWDAFRDDDDYETLLDKILEAMFGTKEGWFLDGNLIGDLRITTKLPLVKDIVSMFDGYSNDRMDTAWAANLVKAYKIWKETIDLATGKLDKPTDATYNGKMTWYGKLYNTLKPLSQMTGFAIANLTRDVSAIWNTTFGAWTGKKLRTYYPGVKTSVKYAYQDGYLTAEEAEKILINEGVAEDENDVYFMLDEWDSGKSSYSKYGAIKDAAKAGDKAAYKSALKDLTDHGITEKNAQSAIRSALKEWYQGTEDTPQSVSKQDTIKKLQEFAGMSKADAEAAALEWTCKIVTGVEYSDIKTAYLDGDVNAVKAKQMLMRYGGLTSEEADKRVQNYKFEEQYGFTYSRSNVQDEYIRGSISEATAKTMLTQYGGKTDEEAERSIQAFNFLRSYPEYDAEDITEAQIAKYYESVDGSGVSVREYVNYASFIRSTSADVDADGNAINGSKMRKVMEYIDSLNLTSQQKDVLFLTQYAKSSLRKTPWH
nr:MAG TPA: Large polyvalent protein associated domain 23 [Caudoviricetes sp.]